MQFAYRVCGIAAVCFPLFAASPAPAPDAAYFGQSLYPILQRAGCPGCHSPDGIAAGTRLHFPEGDASADEVTRFGRSLYKLVDRNNLSNSLLLEKPTRRVAHAGGLRIKPESAEETALLRWIAFLAQNAAAGRFRNRHEGTEVCAATCRAPAAHARAI